MLTQFHNEGRPVLIDVNEIASASATRSGFTVCEMKNGYRARFIDETLEAVMEAQARQLAADTVPA